MRLWVVGIWKDGAARELVGVFSSEVTAVKQCYSPMHFVAPFELDVATPEGVELDGVYYPKRPK